MKKENRGFGVSKAFPKPFQNLSKTNVPENNFDLHRRRIQKTGFVLFSQTFATSRNLLLLVLGWLPVTAFSTGFGALVHDHMVFTISENKKFKKNNEKNSAVKVPDEAKAWQSAREQREVA